MTNAQTKIVQPNKLKVRAVTDKKIASRSWPDKVQHADRKEKAFFTAPIRSK